MRNQNVKFKIRVENLPNHEKEVVKNMLPDKVKFTKHAIEQMKKRKIYTSKNEILANMTIHHIVDIQVDNNNAIKFLVRYPYNHTQDIVIAITQTGIVCTVWTNHKNDTHKTLKDKHLYKNSIRELMRLA